MTDVSGRVPRHHGSPVQGVKVIARCNETGNWASGTTDADGRYTLGGRRVGEGIPRGEYFVVLLEDTSESGPPTIPPKYHIPATSGLRLHVADKKRITFDITLDSSLTPMKLSGQR
jgi:hypothetical protein